MVSKKGKVLSKSKRQIGKTTMSRDKKLKAKAPGKRISKNGKFYYEYRKNHTDVKGVDTPKKIKKKKSKTTTTIKKKKYNIKELEDISKKLFIKYKLKELISKNKEIYNKYGIHFDGIKRALKTDMYSIKILKEYKSNNGIDKAIKIIKVINPKLPPIAKNMLSKSITGEKKYVTIDTTGYMRSLKVYKYKDGSKCIFVNDKKIKIN